MFHSSQYGTLLPNVETNTNALRDITTQVAPTTAVAGEGRERSHDPGTLERRAQPVALAQMSHLVSKHRGKLIATGRGPRKLIGENDRAARQRVGIRVDDRTGAQLQAIALAKLGQPLAQRILARGIQGARATAARVEQLQRRRAYLCFSLRGEGPRDVIGAARRRPPPGEREEDGDDD